MPKPKKDVTNILIIGAIIVLLIIGGVFYLFYTRPCGEDIDCFNKYFTKCTKANVKIVKDGGLYSYTIKGSDLIEREKCVVEVKMEDVLSNDPEEITSLEGKSMTCKIPKGGYNSITEVKQLAQYCHGPLKEGSYELIIKRMYGLVLKNMGSLITEANKIIKKA